MKITTLLFLPISYFGIINSNAQDKKEKTRIIIKSNENGGFTTKEMILDKKISQEEIDKLIAENTIDSSKVKTSKHVKRVTVTVDENGNVNTNEENQSNNLEKSVLEDEIQRREYRFKTPKITREEINRKGRNIIDEIPYRIQRADNFIFENFYDDNHLTIKNIEVFANNPRTESLNVKFRATKKEKIVLILVDIKGKIVAQDSIQDFSGDYIGQMKVDKNLKGNFFLIISQGEEGSPFELI